MKSYFIIIFLFLGLIAKSQNLVKNPSFEIIKRCPFPSGFNLESENWTEIVNNVFLHNPCAPSSSNNGSPRFTNGFQYANSGNSYVTLRAFYATFNKNFRSYVQGTLTQKLKKDSIYCISYFLSLLDVSHGIMKNVDAHLSDTALQPFSPMNNPYIGYPRHVKCTQFISDTSGWMKVSQLYKAKGGEQYITIGNFTDYRLIEAQNFDPKNTNLLVDVHLDDVSVSPIHVQDPDLGNDTSLCDSSFPFVLYAPKGYDSYLWSDGSNSDSLLVLDSGLYKVTCMLTGCGELTDEIRINRIESDDLKLGQDTVLCKGSELLLKPNGKFEDYDWNTGLKDSLIRINQAGLYWLQVSDACRVQRDSIKINIDSVPEIELFIGSDTSLCVDDEYSYPLELSSNIELDNYFWNTGERSKTIQVNKKGNYWLESTFACGTLNSNTVFVDDCPPKKDILFIPNAFSPNDDGLNDVFEPVANGARLTYLKIINRWGKVIFESSTNFQWDGLMAGAPVQSGAYVYLLSYTDEKGDFRSRKGKVIVIP